MTIATSLGAPRSTARGWLGKAPKAVVSLAFTELTFSNSMIEAWWRSLQHPWLFLHSLDSITTVRRLVAFDVDEHNRVRPHSAFHGQSPDEMYVGSGDTVPADLTSRAAAARWAEPYPGSRALPVSSFWLPE